MELNQITGKIKLIVKTKANKNEIISFEDNILKLNIKAIPMKDEANKEIIKFLHKALKKRITIVSGLKSKEKVIQIN